LGTSSKIHPNSPDLPEPIFPVIPTKEPGFMVRFILCRLGFVS
jgi:hypothetical protein